MLGVHDAVIAGGGARHPRLRTAIERAAGCRTLPSDALGVPVGDREAVEWAVLGALAADHVDIALPAVTHRPSGSVPVCGAWIRSSHERSTALNPT
jgi:1,6-anhydro-N-acetylmuramate kinase